jgi:hypothetical protein
MSKVKPLTPADIPSAKKAGVHDAVIEAFNELIAANFNDGEADFTQNAVIELILSKMGRSGLTRNDIFEKGWMNIEEVYEDSGWSVDYDKPIGYAGETFEAHFTFRPRVNVKA